MSAHAAGSPFTSAQAHNPTNLAPVTTTTTTTTPGSERPPLAAREVGGLALDLEPEWQAAIESATD